MTMWEDLRPKIARAVNSDAAPAEFNKLKGQLK